MRRLNASSRMVAARTARQGVGGCGVVDLGGTDRGVAAELGLSPGTGKGLPAGGDAAAQCLVADGRGTDCPAVGRVLIRGFCLVDVCANSRLRHMKNWRGLATRYDCTRWSFTHDHPRRLQRLPARTRRSETGSASCRERVCKYV